MRREDHDNSVRARDIARLRRIGAAAQRIGAPLAGLRRIGAAAQRIGLAIEPARRAATIMREQSQ